jgi:Apea-like HEPN
LKRYPRSEDYRNSWSLAKDGLSGIKVRKITSDYLDTFFYTYADSKSFPKFNQSTFCQSYSRLEDYIYGELQYHSYAPLYSFEMDASRIKIDDDFIIRKINPQEFIAISRNTKDEAPFLKYAVEFHCTIFEYNKKSDEIDRVITSLRLFKQGAVSYSEMYTTSALTVALGESVKSSSRSMQHVPKYNLKQEEGRQFMRFYTDFTSILSKIHDGSLFDIAIDRFNSDLQKRELADKIIDLSIALEALFSTSSEDLTYKLRIRVSVLLGADYDPDHLFDFMNEAYKIRSKLIYGKIDEKAKKVFKIRSNEYRLYDVANELERVTRLSTLRMLSLFKHYHYRKQEVLINVIDKVAIGHPKRILRPKSIHKWKALNCKSEKSI